MTEFGKGTRRVAVFDIGSATVGGAIVDLHEDEKPHILHSIRAPIAFQDELDFERFMRSMFGVFLDVALRLESEGIPRAKQEAGDRDIEDVLCVLSSSWYVNQVKRITLEKDEPFQVSESLFSPEIKKAIEEFHTDKEETAMQTSDSSLLIEQRIIQTTLDGYPTAKPYGKKVKKATASLYLSAISPEIKEKIEEMTEKVYRIKEVSFTTIALVGFSVIRDLYQNEDHFLLIDVSGEVTDVSVIYEDTLQESRSFPIGHNNIIRDIASALHTIPEETPSRVTLYVEGGSTEASNETIHMERAFEAVSEEWNESLKRVLKEMSVQTPIPSTVFLAAGATYGIWFKEMMKRGDFSDVVFTESPFLVTVLGEQQMRPCCDIPKDGKIDPFIALGVLFFNKTQFN